MTSSVRFARISALASLLAACTATEAPLDFVELLSDPLAPATSQLGVAYLRSSRTPEPAEGLLNADHNHFLRVDGDRAVLADEIGPGVITRMWFTAAFPDEDMVARRLVLHLFLDGAEVLFEGQPGIRLERLMSGQVPGFRYPWVLDGWEASDGGYFSAVPIAYLTSARVEVELVPGMQVYYQIDGRTVPPEALPMRAFDPLAADDVDAQLEAATRLWDDHEHPGDDAIVGRRAVARDEFIEHVIPEGSGAITMVQIDAATEARSTLRLRIESDDGLSVDAPLDLLTASGPPAQPHRSAFAESDPRKARFYAPVPFARNARVRVTNDGTASVPVGLRVRVLRTGIGTDVGRLRAVCSDVLGVNAESVCERSPRPDERAANTVVASITGRGQYAGQTYFESTPTCWWFGLENDHEIQIDGSYAILGTGVEDYFGGAYYFGDTPYASPLSGASGWDRTSPVQSIHMYRYHVVDTIPFQTSFSFEYESYVDGTRWSGCSFFYLFS